MLTFLGKFLIVYGVVANKLPQISTEQFIAGIVIMVSATALAIEYMWLTFNPKEFKREVKELSKEKKGLDKICWEK